MFQLDPQLLLCWWYPHVFHHRKRQVRLNELTGEIQLAKGIHEPMMQPGQQGSLEQVERRGPQPWMIRRWWLYFAINGDMYIQCILTNINQLKHDFLAGGLRLAIERYIRTYSTCSTQICWPSYLNRLSHRLGGLTWRLFSGNSKVVLPT